MTITKDEAIRTVVYNDENITSVIKNAPQTYNTILQHQKDNGSMQVVLRRRISRLLKQQKIWKLRIPGTRFGVAIFCTPEHDYSIMVEDSIIGVKIYYMYDMSEDDNSFTLENYWELKGPSYSKWQFYNEPKIIKKHRCLKIWE